jgi:NAD(P)-dependent dehydrogenase (short-subunit alcohol dehydrogenase family)
MRAQGGGEIINISSGVSKVPPERYRTNPVAPYASTKYALNGITLIGRQQLAADNISLGLVYPGVCRREDSGGGRNASGGGLHRELETSSHGKHSSRLIVAHFTAGASFSGGISSTIL